MTPADLRAISHLGQALWADPGYSERLAAETLAAVGMQDLTEDRALERVSMALLKRALLDGVEGNARAVDQPFFRLRPEQRFILSTLHSGRWSYARLGRILERSADEIAEMAWSARLELASMSGMARSVAHPTGSPLQGANCPEYNSARPWTQSFLDDEVAKANVVFLQNHLMACDLCGQALNRCRILYFRVDAVVPRPESDGIRMETLHQALRKTKVLHSPSQVTFVECLEAVASRWDVQLVLGLTTIYFATRFFH